MKADKFKSEFLSLFNNEFSKADYGHIENDEEIVNLKNFTTCIDNIMKMITSRNNFKLKREFLNLDYSFFEQKSIVMLIAVEHENYINRRKKNFNKLINTKAKLKVLICYYDAKKEDANKILDYYEGTYKKLFYDTPDEFLIIMGKLGLGSSQDYKTRIF